MELKLSPAQQRVYEALHPPEDVPVADLYFFARGKAADDARAAQQYVGAIVSQLNRKLTAFQETVRPGVARGTYRLYSLDA